MMETTDILGFNFNELIIMFSLPKIIRLAALIFIGIPLVFFLTKWLRKYLSKKVSPHQGMLFSKIFFYFGFIAIAISILNEMGFKLTHLLAAAGVAGIALGFASQTSISNIISGLFLITEKPFQIDDIINIGNTSGRVISIDTLSVKLRTFDNKYVRIPNENILKSEVTNVTYFPIRRIDLNIGVAYREDLGRVKEILLDIAHKNPLCLIKPEPDVMFRGFGDSSIDMLFVAWATRTDWLPLKNALLKEVKERFDEEGIEIPFPHISLYSGSVTQPLPINLVDNKSSETKET